MKYIENELLTRPGLQEAAKINVEKIKLHCQEAKIIFDIGANAGLFTLEFSVAYPEAEIHAFEPVPRHIEMFEQHMQMNNVRASIHKVALWNDNTKLRLGLPPERQENTGLYSAFFNEKYLEVPAIKLDSYMPGVYPDIAKIDVEGAESQVLEGGVEVLSKLRLAYVERGKKVNKNYPPYERVRYLLRYLGLKLYSEGHDEIWGRNE